MNSPLATPVRLRPHLGKMALLLVGSLLFTLGGALMIRSQGGMGWAVTLFFGACAAVALIQLLPNASWLEIHDDRLVMSTLFKRSEIPFEHVTRFSVVKIQGNSMIGIAFRRDAPQSKGRAFAAAIAGVEGSLPDTYGLKAEQLCSQLNRSLEQYTAMVATNQVVMDKPNPRA